VSKTRKRKAPCIDDACAKHAPRMLGARGSASAQTRIYAGHSSFLCGSVSGGVGDLSGRGGEDWCIGASNTLRHGSMRQLDLTRWIPARNTPKTELKNAIWAACCVKRLVHGSMRQLNLAIDAPLPVGCFVRRRLAIKRSGLKIKIDELCRTALAHGYRERPQCEQQRPEDFWSHTSRRNSHPAMIIVAMKNK
jgi:hypothetical protein